MGLESYFQQLPNRLSVNWMTVDRRIGELGVSEPAVGELGVDELGVDELACR